MKLFGYSPIDYFNRWFAEPVGVTGEVSVQSVLDALNRHPIAQDETAQDYIMPAVRYREKPGRFRIFGENQDTWYCFVYAGTESLCDPPVYFETCLDLKLDHGFSDAEVINGDHVMLCPRFTTFLWHMLGSQICIRLKRNQNYAVGVHGVQCGGINIDDSLINPLGRIFPAGFTSYFSRDVIFVEDWGAAFLNAKSGREFSARFKPIVGSAWA
jgi:hypothetical protein